MLEFAVFQSARTAITIALGLYLAFDLWRMNRGGPALAIQKLQVEPNNPEQLVLLTGRQTGLLAWLYTHLGLEATTTLVVRQKDVRIERQSVKGFDLFYAPIHDVSCSECGYFRAVSFALIAVSLLLGGLVQLFTSWRIDDDYQRQAALAIAGPTVMYGSVFAVFAYWLFEISNCLRFRKGSRSRSKPPAAKSNVSRSNVMSLTTSPLACPSRSTQWSC
jgi:hypothetical protein